MTPRKFHLPFLVFLFLITATWGLQAQRGRSPFPAGQNKDRDGETIDPRKKLEKRMIKESFLAMQRESQQLMDMSTELRDMLKDKTEDELSLDAMKKAEAIEKLAEKIKNRIKNL
jgi:hypothetical protein